MRFSWVAEQLSANHIPFRRLMTLTLSRTFMNEYLLPHSTWYNSEFAFDIGLNGPLVVVVVVGHGGLQRRLCDAVIKIVLNVVKHLLDLTA